MALFSRRLISAVLVRRWWGLRSAQSFVQQPHVFPLLLFLMFSMPVVAEAAALQVLKQKSCSILVSGASGLSKGQNISVQTSKGQTLELKINRIKGDKAMALIAKKSVRCPRVSGQSLALDSALSGQHKKFAFGLTASAGQFTFRQPFVPNEVTDSGETLQGQTVSGLSGVGFTGGILMRLGLKGPLALELGTGALSSTTLGKTTLSNNETYTVTASFLEVMAQPALVLSHCLSPRLFCRAGGVFGFPIGSKLEVKTSTYTNTADLKYTRMGTELALGVNLGKNFVVSGGTQISQDKGSFSFKNSQDSSTPIEVIQIAVLTVYIFGGLTVVF